MNQGTKSIVEQHKDVGVKLVNRGYGHMRDLKNGGVTVIWNDMPDNLRREGWFKLKVKGGELILNKHQLHYLLRNV